MISCGDCNRLPYCSNSKREDIEECAGYSEMTPQQKANRIRHSTYFKMKKVIEEQC